MTVHIQRSVEKEELPEIGQNVFCKTSFMSSGKETFEYLYGYMDEQGDLIKILSHENNDEDNYGWAFEECVEWWLQPVEMPDGEVTEEKIKSLLILNLSTENDYSIEGITESSEELFALHLADKARAVGEAYKKGYIQGALNKDV